MFSLPVAPPHASLADRLLRGAPGLVCAPPSAQQHAAYARSARQIAAGHRSGFFGASIAFRALPTPARLPAPASLRIFAEAEDEFDEDEPRDSPSPRNRFESRRDGGHGRAWREREEPSRHQLWEYASDVADRVQEADGDLAALDGLVRSIDEESAGSTPAVHAVLAAASRELAERRRDVQSSVALALAASRGGVQLTEDIARPSIVQGVRRRVPLSVWECVWHAVERSEEPASAALRTFVAEGCIMEGRMDDAKAIMLAGGEAGERQMPWAALHAIKSLVRSAFRLTEPGEGGDYDEERDEREGGYDEDEAERAEPAFEFVLDPSLLADTVGLFMDSEPDGRGMAVDAIDFLLSQLLPLRPRAFVTALTALFRAFRDAGEARGRAEFADVVFFGAWSRAERMSCLRAMEEATQACWPGLGPDVPEGEPLDPTAWDCAVRLARLHARVMAGDFPRYRPPAALRAEVEAADAERAARLLRRAARGASDNHHVQVLTSTLMTLAELPPPLGPPLIWELFREVRASSERAAAEGADPLDLGPFVGRWVSLRLRARSLLDAPDGRFVAVAPAPGAAADAVQIMDEAGEALWDVGPVRNAARFASDPGRLDAALAEAREAHDRGEVLPEAAYLAIARATEALREPPRVRALCGLLREAFALSRRAAPRSPPAEGEARAPKLDAVWCACAEACGWAAVGDLQRMWRAVAFAEKAADARATNWHKSVVVKTLQSCAADVALLAAAGRGAGSPLPGASGEPRVAPVQAIEFGLARDLAASSEALLWRARLRWSAGPAGSPRPMAASAGAGGAYMAEWAACRALRSVGFWEAARRLEENTPNRFSGRPPRSVEVEGLDDDFSAGGGGDRWRGRDDRRGRGRVLGSGVGTGLTRGRGGRGGRGRDRDGDDRRRGGRAELSRGSPELRWGRFRGGRSGRGDRDGGGRGRGGSSGRDRSFDRSSEGRRGGRSGGRGGRGGRGRDWD